MIKPLFKGLQVAPFVECSYCHILVPHDTKLCATCSHEIKTEKDQLIHFVVLNTGASYTPFVECPNCHKLARVGVSRCPDCYEEITEEYALSSALAVVTNTIACDVASSISSFDAFAPLALIISVFIYLVDWYGSGVPRLSFLILWWPLMPLMMTLLWFYRFGGFRLGDDEYQASRRSLLRTLALWLGILAVQVMALVAWALW